MDERSFAGAQDDIGTGTAPRHGTTFGVPGLRKLEVCRAPDKNVSWPRGQASLRQIHSTDTDPLCMSSSEPNKVIYSMMGVSKSFDKKLVLKDIWLSYFY